MNDLHLQLTASAVEAILSGSEVVADLPEAGVRVFLRCDDAAVMSFKEHIEKALLRLLPVDNSIH